ncbi:MAG: hypothetical protein C4325_11265 [Blastocatellia bacterium]
MKNKDRTGSIAARYAEDKRKAALSRPTALKYVIATDELATVEGINQPTGYARKFQVTIKAS